MVLNALIIVGIICIIISSALFAAGFVYRRTTGRRIMQLLNDEYSFGDN